MKKLFILTFVALISLTSLHANYSLKHANPMPNLVHYAVGNAEILGITKQQVTELQAWGRTHKPKIQELIKTVMMEEKMLLDEALGADENVVEKSQKMLDARKEIIKIKTDCRMNMKKILSKKQYEQLVNLYRTTLSKHGFSK